MCVRARACVRACVCVRARARACVCACVRVCVFFFRTRRTGPSSTSSWPTRSAPNKTHNYNNIVYIIIQYDAYVPSQDAANRSKFNLILAHQIHPKKANARGYADRGQFENELKQARARSYT